MNDKNGREIKVGNRIKDNVGKEGEMANICGVKAVKFKHDGKVRCAFPHKLIESQMEVIYQEAPKGIR